MSTKGGHLSWSIGNLWSELLCSPRARLVLKNQTVTLLCNVDTCFCKVFLNLNVFSQLLQGMDTPSKWYSSMWLLMLVGCPSFPHFLQIFAVVFLLPVSIIFWLVSIMELTVWSNSCRSPYISSVVCDTRAFLSLLLDVFVDAGPLSVLDWFVQLVSFDW